MKVSVNKLVELFRWEWLTAHLRPTAGFHTSNLVVGIDFSSRGIDMEFSKDKQNSLSGPRGITLVELLVVITIIGIIITLAVPRLRLVNEDRAVRETGRIASSTFNRAINNALADGASGIVIELNSNIIDADNVQYAGTVLYVAKAVAPYSGDEFDSLARKVSGFEVSIPLPFGQMTRPIVQVGDSISVNSGSVKYTIFGLTPNVVNNTLTLDLNGNSEAVPPLPGVNSTEYPFVIERLPRIQESSRVELPEGFIIDLRYSGDLIGGPPYAPARSPLPFSGALPRRTIFHEPTIPPNPAIPNTFPKNRQTRIFFRQNSSIDFYTVYPTGNPKVPEENLYFFISRFEVDPTLEQVTSVPSPLDNPANLWLVINRKTGATSISYNIPPPVALAFDQRIEYARRAARQLINADD